MSKFLLKLSTIFSVAVLAVMFSCAKEEVVSSEEVENYVEETVYYLHRDGNCGRFGCFELVFPLNLSFPDGTTAEVNSYEELKQAIRSWRADHPDAAGWPTFAFPFEVVSEDGEVITVNNREELFQLRRRCWRTFFDHHGPRDHRDRGDFCFSLNFPLTIEFPDGTTAEANDRAELKMLVREWRANNPDVDQRPHVVFPITVTMEDGTVVTVDSREALIELKESCDDD